MTTGSEQEKTPQDTGKKETSSGLEPKVAGLLCYVLGWITGVIFLLIEKDNKFVRFHAIQSIVVFGAFTAVWIVLSMLDLVVPSPADVLFVVLSWLLWIASVILWIVLMIKAYQEEKFKLPIAGDYAEEHA